VEKINQGIITPVDIEKSSYEFPRLRRVKANSVPFALQRFLSVLGFHFFDEIWYA